jgi:hypothetical protein
MLVTKLSRWLKHIYRLPIAISKQRRLAQADLLAGQKKWLEVLKAISPKYTGHRPEGSHG